MSKAVQRNYIEEFRSAFSVGIENIVKAATVYVAAIDESPEMVEKFANEFADTIPPGAWSGFEAVGRKWMHPKLLMGGGGKYANKIRKLPYSAQCRVFEGDRFEMLTKSGDILRVDLRDLEPDQAKQMFAKDHVRTLSEQKAWIEDNTKPAIDEFEILPYEIRGGCVMFRKNTELTRAELKRLLQEM